MLEYISLVLIVLVFVPFFTWRGYKALEQNRWGKFFYCAAISFYVLRLGYLRVSTSGGQTGYFSPGLLSFTKELGNPIAFMVFTAILFLTAVHRMLDDEKYYRENFVPLEKYEKLDKKYQELRAIMYTEP